MEDLIIAGESSDSAGYSMQSLSWAVKVNKWQNNIKAE